MPGNRSLVLPVCWRPADIRRLRRVRKRWRALWTSEGTLCSAELESLRTALVASLDALTRKSEAGTKFSSFPGRWFDVPVDGPRSVYDAFDNRITESVNEARKSFTAGKQSAEILGGLPQERECG